VVVEDPADVVLVVVLDEPARVGPALVPESVQLEIVPPVTAVANAPPATRRNWRRFTAVETLVGTAALHSHFLGRND
jgi:hypothetical protein